MKKFNYEIDFSFITKKENIPTDLKEYFENIFLTAIKLSNKDGIDYSQQRKLINILDKLYDKSTNGTVELEDAEFDLIDESFKNAKFPPEMVRVVNNIYNSLELARR